MHITVAICTWNRSTLLRQALEQMTRLEVPPGLEWELLVVNNNCTDYTDDVIASFRGVLPIRRLFEKTPGLANARNKAIREGHGDYILWTDDDTVVDKNWIAAYVKAFQRWPGAALFGGPVRPWFAVPPPDWLRRVWPHVTHAYALRDLGPEPLRFSGGRIEPVGANYGVRMKEQRRFPYNPKLGRKAGSYLGGEETILVEALLAEGFQGWWIPDAIVEHFIPPERMTVGHLRRYFSGHGEYLAMSEPPWTGAILCGRPRWLWRRALEAEAKYRLRSLLFRPEVWIEDLIDTSITWGRLRVPLSPSESCARHLG